MRGPSHRQVACFLEVCRDFHFSNAAKRLGIAQPPLSRHIKELEQLVEAPLFRREGRRIELTPAGTAFLKEVYPLPAILSRAVDAARRASTGEVSHLRIGFVGALMSEDLFEAFESFRSQHPNTQLTLLDLSPAELLKQIETGAIDGGFLGVTPRTLPKGVESLAWREEPLQVCLPKGHRLAGRKRLRISDLSREALIALSQSVAPSYREFLDTVFEEGGERTPMVRESNTAAGMLSMVVAGCGVALLPRSATRGVEGRVAAIPLVAKGARLKEAFLHRPVLSEELAAFRSLLAATAKRIRNGDAQLLASQE